jgi:hypothetical protein
LAEAASDHDFAAEVFRIRGLLQAEGRSESLLRLFDYLHLHSQDIRAPKEIEIAFEVFGKDLRFDTSQDAMVRVWVHRLRTRLDEIYRDVPGPRLTVPKGEYRITLIEPVTSPTMSEVPATPFARAALRRMPLSRIATRWVVILALLTLLGWAALFYVRARPEGVEDQAGSLFSAAQVRCGMPLAVVGDNYLYVQTRPDGQPPRLVMQPAITSAAELETARVDAGANGGQVLDRDTYYMAASSADGLWSLLGATSVLGSRGSRPPAVLPNSKLTQQTLNRGNILYFGRLDQLGLLRDAVFEASRFTFDPLSDTLVDERRKRQFTAQLTGANGRGDRNPLRRPAFTRDYGYIARIVKPDGCALVIAAGLQDAALPQVARIAGDQAQLAALSRQTKVAPSFEALYEIRSLGPLRHESRLVTARALHPAR